MIGAQPLSVLPLSGGGYRQLPHEATGPLPRHARSAMAAPARAPALRPSRP